MMKEHPEAYSPKAGERIVAVRLREQITSRAGTVFWLLWAASGLVFLIACSNAANLILARTTRREYELAIRVALGASSGGLRGILLAESLLLCGGGAVIGVLSARPLVKMLAHYASRFSVRALDVTVDSSMLWAGGALATIAAVTLAFVPRLPVQGDANGTKLAGGRSRVTANASGRLRGFAVTQIAASFLLMAGAATLGRTRVALRAAGTGMDTRHVLTLNLPVNSYGRTPDQVVDFCREALRRIARLPGVDGVALGTQTPWRERG